MYVCGWEGSEYSCKLISQESKSNESIVEILPMPEPVKVQFPDFEEFEDYFDE